MRFGKYWNFIIKIVLKAVRNKVQLFAIVDCFLILCSTFTHKNQVNDVLPHNQVHIEPLFDNHLL